LRRNYEFKKVERLEGGIGLLQVDDFYPAEWIAETAAGAMSFLTLTKYADKPDLADNLKRVLASEEKELKALKAK
jgi:hypothetical protein